VNAGIRPNYGEARVDDKWQIWPATGWCHDYVVTKREELLLRGIASQLCECIAPDGEHHLVLLVDCVVLDNLTPEIGPMRYQVVRTQSIYNPGRREAS
jgi:predicted transglutaminase-like cysteine proteinase